MPSGARRPPTLGAGPSHGGGARPRSRSPRPLPKGNDRDGLGRSTKPRQRSPLPTPSKGVPSRKGVVEKTSKQVAAEAALRRKAKVPAATAKAVPKRRRKPRKGRDASPSYSYSSSSYSPSLAMARPIGRPNQLQARSRSPVLRAGLRAAPRSPSRTPSPYRPGMSPPRRSVSPYRPVGPSPAGRNDEDSEWRGAPPPMWGSGRRVQLDRRSDFGKGKGKLDSKGKGKGKGHFGESWGSGGGGGYDDGDRWSGGSRSKGKSRGRGGGAGGYQVAASRVHVSNLPKDITEGNLEHLFGQHGKVLGLQLLAGAQRGQTCAIVRYESHEDAEASIDALHAKYEVRAGDGPIVVKLAKPNPRWDS
mmetsp:Transcript_25527/g.71882  ORF Transcript_25527/g.71882 Transcript_25527/m.71882 type:complete len:361 (+) Transcript_25527:131-1213(+)